MRSAAFIRPGVVEWRQAPNLQIEAPVEALVRPLVAGRCDLDVAYLRGLLPMPSGAAIGHEVIGEVVEVGAAVSRFEVGQRVFVPAQISCGQCSRCVRGLTARCEHVPFAASYGMGRQGDYGGGLADLMRVPYADAMLTKLPGNVDATSVIGIADMATDAWRAVAPHLLRNPGASVLVLGGMPAVIGLYAVGIAAALDAQPIHYVDNDENRRAVAVAYGAEVIDEDQAVGGDGYDIVVVAFPTRHALETAFHAAAPGGMVTSVAPTADGAPQLDTAALYHRGVTWTISRPDCRTSRDGALQLWATAGFRTDVVPASVIPWDEAPSGWASDDLYVVAARDGVS